MLNEIHHELMDLETVDKASEKDRQFFLDHPGAQHYYRPFIPGEAPLIGIEIVKVTQIYPGHRTRQFFYRNGGRA